MSADEIRRLAKRAKELASLPDDHFGVSTWDEENHYQIAKPTREVRSALLDYAAMVERCEESLKCNFVAQDGRTTINSAVKAQVNYILKGAT